MGSYSTAEVSSAPRSIRSSYGGNPTGGSSTPTTRPRLNTEVPTRSQSNVDATLPTIISIGGGLSTMRIVKKVPDEIKTGEISGTVQYLLGEASTPEEIAVKEQVRERMTKADYRLVINSQYNLSNTATTGPTSTYFKPTHREVDGNRVQFNILDIAIISHEEGGRTQSEKVRKTLEARL